MAKKSQVESVISGLSQAGKTKLAQELSTAFGLSKKPTSKTPASKKPSKLASRKITADFGNSEVIDSRDIIQRLEELRESSETPAEKQELAALEKLNKQCEDITDWEHGRPIIRNTYFTTYIKELIHDVFEWPPKGINIKEWPYKHMVLDYNAAAKEALADYETVTFMGRRWFVEK